MKITNNKRIKRAILRGLFPRWLGKHNRPHRRFWKKWATHWKNRPPSRPVIFCTGRDSKPVAGIYAGIIEQIRSNVEQYGGYDDLTEVGTKAERASRCQPSSFKIWIPDETLAKQLMEGYL